MSVGSIEVDLFLPSGWKIREVDGQVGSIGLRQIVLLFFRWNIFPFISGDEDDSFPVDVSFIILLWWFVLEELDVYDTVEESVSCATHNDVLFIGHYGGLQLVVLLIRVCLELEVALIVFFLTLDQHLVILLECVMVQ